MQALPTQVDEGIVVVLVEVDVEVVLDVDVVDVEVDDVVAAVVTVVTPLGSELETFVTTLPRAVCDIPVSSSV